MQKVVSFQGESASRKTDVIPVGQHKSRLLDGHSARRREKGNKDNKDTLANYKNEEAG
jgi:hypothetical protein